MLSEDIKNAMIFQEEKQEQITDAIKEVKQNVEKVQKA